MKGNGLSVLLLVAVAGCRPASIEDAKAKRQAPEVVEVWQYGDENRGGGIKDGGYLWAKVVLCRDGAFRCDYKWSPGKLAFPEPGHFTGKWRRTQDNRLLFCQRKRGKSEKLEPEVDLVNFLRDFPRGQALVYPRPTGLTYYSVRFSLRRTHPRPADLEYFRVLRIERDKVANNSHYRHRIPGRNDILHGPYAELDAKTGSVRRITAYIMEHEKPGKFAFHRNGVLACCEVSANSRVKYVFHFGPAGEPIGQLITVDGEPAEGTGLTLYEKRDWREGEPVDRSGPFFWCEPDRPEEWRGGVGFRLEHYHNGKLVKAEACDKSGRPISSD